MLHDDNYRCLSDIKREYNNQYKEFGYIINKDGDIYKEIDKHILLNIGDLVEMLGIFVSKISSKYYNVDEDTFEYHLKDI